METILIDLLETILCVPHVKIELADHYAHQSSKERNYKATFNPKVEILLPFAL
jgi:hypothetical protein